MQIRWYGQSAFSLVEGNTTVFIDPFGEMSGLAARAWRFDYPAAAFSGDESGVVLPKLPT